MPIISKICLVITLVLLAIPAGAKAQLACPMIGCLDGFTIEISPDYRWKQGDYQFDFIIDGKNLSCKGRLPFSSCEQQIKCSGEGVLITESGCMLPAEGHGYGNISLSSSPKYVALTIKRSGFIIGKSDWHPDYKISTPNGKQCEPTCRQATVSIKLAD